MTTRKRQPVPRQAPAESGLINLVTHNLPAIISMVALGGLFYGTTSWKLDDIYEWRKTETAEHKVVQEKLTAIKDSDDANREKVRTEFLRRQDETNKTLSELDKKLAISDTKQQQMVDVLKDISSTLGNLSLAAGHPTGTIRKPQ